jgi:hypothetical protein
MDTDVRMIIELVIVVLRVISEVCDGRLSDGLCDPVLRLMVLQ